jgi:hypothetical protein
MRQSHEQIGKSVWLVWVRLPWRLLFFLFRLFSMLTVLLDRNIYSCWCFLWSSS